MCVQILLDNDVIVVVSSVAISEETSEVRSQRRDLYLRRRCHVFVNDHEDDDILRKDPSLIGTEDTLFQLKTE